MIPTPKEMTAAERERHVASGHLPYDPRCERCVSCKRPNVPHTQSHEYTRTIPLLVGDYGFIKDGIDEDNATALVLKLYTFKLNFSCLVASKGSDPLVVARLCQFIMECGLVHFAYRSDREPAIVSLIQDACAMAESSGVKIQAVEDEAAEPEVEKTMWLFLSIAFRVNPSRTDWRRAQSKNLSIKFALSRCLWNIE